MSDSEGKKKPKKKEMKEIKEADIQSQGPGKSDDFDAEPTIDIHEFFQGLDKSLKLEELLIPPNAVTVEDIVRVVNDNRPPNAVQSIIGKLIEPGKIGVIEYNGKVQVIGPGRWVLPNPRAELKKIVSLSENTIRLESLTIVRVQRGEIGLAVENGQPLILGEGVHVHNNRMFEFEKCVNVNKPYLKHMSFHIIRVDQGHYGLVTENTIPKLLPEGVHVTNSNVFSFDGTQLINQPYVNHGTLHILRIPRGNVALVNENNKPNLLEGTHCINSKTFSYHKMEDLMQSVIRHGTITRFIVRKGEVGLAWENNQPVFYEEGLYLKDSPFFVFDRCVPAADKQITLGAKKIVTVYDGEVGISYLKGKLVVLFPNRHLIDSTNHVFQGFLSTQQQCLRLFTKSPETKKKGAHSEDDVLLICETKDFVEIGLRADVFYQIDNAEKALLVVGKDNINTLVRDTATATLNSIIRSTSLAEVAQNKEIAAKSLKQHYEQNPSAPLFFEKVHDEFISKLHDNFIELYGINITNIRIESFKIMNAELAHNISQQAFLTAQTQNQLANLTGQTEIATAQQRRDAEVARIKAEGDAVRLTTETNAKNKAVMETAKSDAEANVMKAKAEAQAIELKAQADAKSILLMAEAESKRAEMLNSTPLGGQLQMYQMYADMVQASMKGVEKVVYLPPTPEGGGMNPMSLFAMQGIMNQPNQNAVVTRKAKVVHD